MWGLIVSVPDHCLSFYFNRTHLIMLTISVIAAVQLNVNS